MKNKILFVTPSFSKGGAEKNIANIVNLLSKEFEIYLIVCNDQIGYYSVIKSKINLIILNKKSVKNSIWDIFKIIKEIKPNIIFSSALHLGLPIIFLKKLFFLNFKSVIRVPTLPSNKLAKSNFKTLCLTYFIKRFLNYSDLIVAQTIEMKNEILKYYSCHDYKVKVIQNIVDVDTILQLSQEHVNFKKRGYTFVASGSLYSAKGFDLLIEAFCKHLVKYPDSNLFILGSESSELGYKNFLEKLILKLGVTDNVKLLGHKVNPYKYYNFCDAFVLSSRKEGFPNVVLENLFLNKPILVTDCVDFSNYINEKNGLIVKKNSVNELEYGLNMIRELSLKPIVSKIENYNYNDLFNKLIDEGSSHYQ